jgi:hypothetical protein
MKRIAEDGVMKSIIGSAGIISILFIILGLVIPCQASDINIVGTVTPISGKEDTNFIYSATITFSKGNLDINSALNIELIISDNRVNKSVSQSGKFYGNGLSPKELIRGRSDPFTFSFNPGQEGLTNIDDLTYEFVLTTSSGKELARNKYPGPKIVIPPEFQSIQYSKTPVYYFQEFPITLTFNDKPSVIPMLKLLFRGPLNSTEEMSWTEDLSATSAGTTHTFSKSIDFTKFPTGGNFSFNFTYDDSRANEGYAPITGGPYYFTILPYSPKIVEPIGLAKQIEYNNFTLRALVEDEGKVLMGDLVGSSASLIIDHPTNGEMIFNNSVPTQQGKYLVFEWDKDSVLFEKSDVLLSKEKPFQARLTYWNDNWKYGANSSNYSFALENITPLLTETHEPVLFTTGNETAPQKVRAYVTYAKGMGDLKIAATGSEGRYEDILKGSPAGVNKYEYDWSLPFNKSQAGNYTLSFTYIHDSLENGSYEFEPKPGYSFQVVPIFIEFKNGNVSQSRGRWNDSYSYTVGVNSSVEAGAILQIFNPCSSEWADAGGVQKIKAGKSNIIWTIQPFAYDCNELNSGKYRFRANFLGRDFSSTRAYEGPEIINDAVRLSSLSKPLVPDVTGTVSPKRGVLQGWQESDKLYAFTYSAQLKNLSPEDAPWVELLVKAPGSSWKTVGEKQQYDPAESNISWTVKPFFDREFLGAAEFKFLVDGVESKVFRGPEIVVIYKGLNYEKSSKLNAFNYFGKVNASINLSIDLLSSDDNVQWKNIGKPQKYTAGSGEALRSWNDLPAIRYFEFDFRTDTGGVIS